MRQHRRIADSFRLWEKPGPMQRHADRTMPVPHALLDAGLIGVGAVFPRGAIDPAMPIASCVGVGRGARQ